MAWVLVSAGIVVLPHLCREDSPLFLTWVEMLAAWPVLRHHGGAKEEWLRVREDLSKLGQQPTWGHRIGGVSARTLWEAGRLQDHAAGLLPPEPSAHWRGLLDGLGRGDVSEGEFEASLRAEWGDRLKGVRGDVARCGYGASREGGALGWCEGRLRDGGS